VQREMKPQFANQRFSRSQKNAAHNETNVFVNQRVFLESKCRAKYNLLWLTSVFIYKNQCRAIRFQRRYQKQMPRKFEPHVLTRVDSPRKSWSTSVVRDAV
jgi:hypothetical protein